MGCMRTIKNLEKENQAKQDRISSLAIELDKKSKLIDSLSSEKSTWSQSYLKGQAQSTISVNQKKREKELEQKVKDQDHLIADQKRQMSRFQEMNKSLIEKIKELEQTLLEKPLNHELQTSSEDIIKLKKDLEKARSDQRHVRAQEKQKTEYLEKECQLYKERYETLKTEAYHFE